MAYTEDMTLREIRDLVHKRELSVTDIVAEHLRRIEELQPRYNAFISWNAEQTLETARHLDSQAAKGNVLGPLHGAPIGVKDNFVTQDFATTAASGAQDRDLETSVDAEMVARLRANGAVIIGKTNIHEWAYGATNKTSTGGVTRNPWNQGHITGGSSGGSGAAVSAGIVPAALGSDTGGSIRIPASACGISGLKPTFGRVPMGGVLPLAWSLDVAGPMARTAEDLQILWEMLRLDAGPKHEAQLDVTADVNQLRVGCLGGEEMVVADEVRRSVEAVSQMLERSGANCDPIMVANFDEGFAMWKVILHAEAAAYHTNTLIDDADSYSIDVRTQLEAGRCISAVEYLQAQRFRHRFVAAFVRLFDRRDVIVMPTLPIAAPPIDHDTVTIGDRTTTAQDAMTGLPWLASLTGCPAISVPCGFAASGLPIGVTFLGPPGSDEQLLRIATFYQTRTSWHDHRPPRGTGVVSPQGPEGG